MPTTITLSAVRDRTSKFNISVFQSDAVTPQSLAGTTLDFYASSGLLAIHKSSPSSGITITDAANGLATLELSPNDTSAYTAQTTVPCELTLTVAASGDVDSIGLGLLTVVLNVG